MRILLPVSEQVGRLNAFYANFRDGLIEAIAELGHEAVPFSFAEPARASAAEQSALYRRLTQAPCDLVLDLCCWGCELSQFRVWDGSAQGEPLYDAFELPCVAMLYDNPWFQTLPRVLASRLYASLPDRYGAEQIALTYPQVRLRGTALALPGIRAANNRARPWNERTIDILYVGNLVTGALGRLWREFPNAAAFDALADRALAEPQRPLHRLLNEAADDAGLHYDAVGTIELLRAVDYFLRARFRMDAVNAVARSGARVHVVGSGWSDIDLPPNVSVQAPVAYTDMFALAGRSKICLDCSNYPGGVNDRVFNYTLNAAVCFTNAGESATQALGQEAGVRSFSFLELEGLTQAVGQALSRPDELQDDAAAAARATAATQTWRHRLENILQAVFGESK